MFCKYCGKELADKAKFCSKCGKRLGVKDSLKNEDFSESQQSLESDENEIQKSLKFCKFCGEKISAAAKFCPKCGRNLVIKSEQKTEETNKSNTIIAKEVFQTEKITEPIAKTEYPVKEEKVVHSEESPQTTNTAVSEEK
ncbi:MAG: zinc ribbon domain-containing protein, partial [Spirochaetaceae bacterium]|nr:zinc ribbon domain-containing protein [Spirochaetaceae bacterium]